MNEIKACEICVLNIVFCGAQCQELPLLEGTIESSECFLHECVASILQKGKSSKNPLLILDVKICVCEVFVL